MGFVRKESGTHCVGGVRHNGDMSEFAGSAAWVTKPWVAFDTETTGVSSASDRIVTAAVVTRHEGFRPGLTHPGGAVDTSDDSRTWLADPGVPIPATASEIHGITTEYARQFGRPSAEVLEEVNAVLASQMSSGGVVVVFNSSYDLTLLEAESKRHGVTPLARRLDGKPQLVVDPLVLDRAVNKYRRGKRTLTALVQAFGLDMGSAHDAAGDCHMTLNVLTALLETNPQLLQFSATNLQDFQRSQHAIWAEDFERFLASRGRNTHISRRWP